MLPASEHRYHYVCVVFDIKVLRQIIGPEKYRNDHNGELNNLYFSPNIRVIRSRSMRRAGHVARLREYEKCMQCFLGEDCRK